MLCWRKTWKCEEPFSQESNDGWENLHSGSSGRLVLNGYMHRAIEGTHSQREAASALEKRHSRCNSIMKQTV